MAVSTRPLCTFAAVLLVYVVEALAADETNNTISGERVGWKEGPNTRGTLNIVWSCGITIFTCTWTIMHLNLPKRDDSTLKIFFRRLKWMSINILFPEFILSKAICDLRQALDELRQFDENLPKSPQSRNQNTASPPAPPAIRVLVHNSPRKWTVVHSYYAQMGGILTISAWNDPPWFDPDFILTSIRLTSQYEWADSSEHPLKHLRLSREEIEDKSKADSMLKCLAIFQIMWLILNVTVRAATGLHVTQLEIATVAFATVAILTYLASWWKPKDVSEATGILHPCGGHWKHEPDVVTLSQWFRYPGSKDGLRFERRPQHRVPDDLIFEASSMAFLLSISSLLFGGLHCVAWNFEFPSQAELVAWRIGCATIAVLPAIALAFTTLLASVFSSWHARYIYAVEQLDLHPARYISTISYTFYPAARLLTIVLLFTSLRSLPADVYQVDPWVNFLPKIS
ncbi:hypothetical protein K456DRAFT_1832154 [Colletotrichum gloeosporioides 23]|nr:hypothetical protein K456DRAFT_1832154 [Colletotrichum gloeosporioides 23]